MDRFRKIAYEILDLKKELLNSGYSDVIKKALEVTVDRMLAEGFIDIDISLYLKDNTVTIESLELALKNSQKYTKTTEELYAEYELLVGDICNILISRGLDRDIFYVTADMEKDKLNICSKHYLTEGFIKNYFYIPGKDKDAYYERLMRKKGFIGQYAMLRLPRIMDMYILESEVDIISLEKSHAYYQADKKCYAIDLVIGIQTEAFDDLDKAEPLINEIVSIVNGSQEFFNSKLTV